MYSRIPPFLIWASVLTALSRRFICDFISITSQQGYNPEGMVVLVTIAYLISYKRRKISRTYLLSRDSGLRPFYPGSSCFMPADFLPTITPLWLGVI